MSSDNTTETTAINFTYTLDIECPYCKAGIDLVSCDDEGFFANAIFNNKWDDLVGEEITCTECDKIIEVSEVSY